MHGAFKFGFEETILFKGWRTTDEAGIVGSMIGIILLGMIYEGLKNYREYLNVSNATSHPRASFKRSEAIFSTIHILQTILHGVQVVIGYFLMFIFMSYNILLCIAVVIGAVLGYFIFSWKNARCDISECCS